MIGHPAGTPLPADMTKWEIVLDQLTTDLEFIPFATGPWPEDPAAANITIANFEVVESAALPGNTPLTLSIYLPFTLSSYFASNPGALP